MQKDCCQCDSGTRWKQWYTHAQRALRTEGIHCHSGSNNDNVRRRRQWQKSETKHDMQNTVPQSLTDLMREMNIHTWIAFHSNCSKNAHIHTERSTEKHTAAAISIWLTEHICKRHNARTKQGDCEKKARLHSSLGSSSRREGAKKQQQYKSQNIHREHNGIYH